MVKLGERAGFDVIICRTVISARSARNALSFSTWPVIGFVQAEHGGPRRGDFGGLGVCQYGLRTAVRGEEIKQLARSHIAEPNLCQA